MEDKRIKKNPFCILERKIYRFKYPPHCNRKKRIIKCMHGIIRDERNMILIFYFSILFKSEWTKKIKWEIKIFKHPIQVLHGWSNFLPTGEYLFAWFKLIGHTKTNCNYISKNKIAIQTATRFNFVFVIKRIKKNKQE